VTATRSFSGRTTIAYFDDSKRSRWRSAFATQNHARPGPKSRPAALDNFLTNMRIQPLATPNEFEVTSLPRPNRNRAEDQTDYSPGSASMACGASKAPAGFQLFSRHIFLDQADAASANNISFFF